MPGPWTIGSAPTLPPPVPAVVALSKAWREHLVRERIYTRDEMDALEDPARVTSWAAPPDQQYGPRTMLARSDGDIVAGVELWQQQRDRYWFLESLIRDQSDRFKGLGHELVDAAVAYFHEMNINGYGLRVHAMAREQGAVWFWTRHLHRDPDFVNASVWSRGLNFPAVGWVIT